MKKLFTLFFCSFLAYTQAQNIPESRKVDWEICGYEGEIPCASTLRDAVQEFGIDNSGNTDVTSAVNAALISINDGEALYFPNGTYLFNGPVEVPSNRIIRGESPEATILNFSFAGDNTCISVKGTGPSGAITTASSIGDFREYDVTVVNASGFSIGDDVELYQANDDALHGAEDMSDNVTWAADLKGQMAKIEAINGNVITLDRSLVFDYDINFVITLRKVEMIEEVGLENFKLIRGSNNGTGAANNNFWINYAKNCWVRKVHSEYSSRYHFRIDFSRNIEATECFLDKAYDCGGGGAGYGFLIQDHATECKFENNIAKALRHPWIPKEGAARNVFAYNFSSGTTQGSACSSDPLTDSYADISLHGHYPAYNLFEGNIVYRITSSDAWGPNGPGNTFLRNRVLGKNGIWIKSYSKEQNVVGNEFTYPNADFEMDRDGTISGTTLNYSNFDMNGLLDDPAPSSVEESYYLQGKPEYFGSDAWPSIGPDVAFNTGEVPAQKRFNSGQYFTDSPVCSACQLPNLGIDQSLCGKTEVTLNCGYENSQALSFNFKWYKDGLEINGLNSQEAVFTVAGVIEVEADSSGCVGTDQITITATLPTLDLGPDQELCTPSEVLLEGNIADPNYSYLWTYNGTSINDAKKSSYLANKGGGYQLTVDADGCDPVMDLVMLTSSLLEVKGDTICKLGDDATVEVSGNSSYNWFAIAEGGSSIGNGNQINTALEGPVYVEDADGFSALVGMMEPDFTNSKTWDDDRFERKLTFDVLAKLTLDSLSFWPSTANSVTVRVLESDNATVAFEKTYSTVSQDIENRVLFGAQLDPGSYYLDFEGTDGEMYYSNDNDLSIQYPYTVDGIISITGAEPSWITTSAYYLFAYNWRVTAGNACDRTAVDIVIDDQHKDCLITGTSDEEGFESFIYPNPSTSGFRLQGIESAAITVLTSSGKVVESRNIQKGEVFGNLLEQGAYILQVVTNDGLHHLKIVKY